MQRIIYLDTHLGYKQADVKNNYQLLSKEIKLRNHGHYIICVLDLGNETIVEKCDSFLSHAGFIKQCYPNYLPDSGLPEVPVYAS